MQHEAAHHSSRVAEIAKRVACLRSPIAPCGRLNSFSAMLAHGTPARRAGIAAAETQLPGCSDGALSVAERAAAAQSTKRSDMKRTCAKGRAPCIEGGACPGRCGPGRHVGCVGCLRSVHVCRQRDYDCSSYHT